MVDGAGINPLLGDSTAVSIENAAERQFGPEYEEVHILSNAQVSLILQASARSAVNRDEELNEVYRKTQKYVERFNTMTNPEKDHQELVDEMDNLQEYVVRII
jgi:DNA-directed RNA polymerase II subunit RPB4